MGYSVLDQLVRRFRPGLIAALVLLSLLLTGGFAPARAGLADRSYDEAIAAFRQAAGSNDQLVAENAGRIKALSYTDRRAFRAFCLLPGIGSTKLVELLGQLAERHIQFAHLPLLEYYVLLPGADRQGADLLLAELASLDYVASQALVDLPRLKEIEAQSVVPLVKDLAKLDEAGRWAIGAFFSLPAGKGEHARVALTSIHQMNEQQRRAAESLCRLPQLDAPTALPLLTRLRALSDGNARNIAALFRLPAMNPAKAVNWLDGYFATSLADQENEYRRLADDQKELLLKAFGDAASGFIWQLNNLHDVTDSLGWEISGATLAGYSGKGLNALFRRLQPRVQEQFARQMDQATASGNHQAAIATLRQATTQARRQAALDLSTANIYAILAHGNDLYDSSFRDILVPVLHSRLNAIYAADLLAFLREVDPGHGLVADFITHMAQKGKLVEFMPADPGQQRLLVDLVAASAFRDENSLILFSASFNRLLASLQPEARSYLLEVLLAAAQSDKSVFRAQLQVILQYFLAKHAQLLSASNHRAITAFIQHRGAIDISPYIRTPFAQWKSDRLLTSLSIFQQDDDGRTSYLANSHTLLANGYRPELSRHYTLASLPQESRERLGKLLTNLNSQANAGLTAVFQLAAHTPLVIDWHKTVNGQRITHSVYIYQGKDLQRDLLEQFLKGEHEMLAQRGHSYWRFEQLVDPLETLLKRGRITAATLTERQRFLSIGSCGGIKVYTRLNQLFHNSVDILATVGTGKTAINNPYNQQFLEIIARSPDLLSWDDVARSSAEIFSRNLGEEYLQPGSLPAILHKMMDLPTTANAAH